MYGVLLTCSHVAFQVENCHMVGEWMSKDAAVALLLAQVMRYVMSVSCLWYVMSVTT